MHKFAITVKKVKFLQKSLYIDNKSFKIVNLLKKMHTLPIKVKNKIIAKN